MTLEPKFVSRNGTNKATVTARGADGEIIHSDTFTVESAIGRRRFAKRLAEISGEDIDTIDRQVLTLLDAPKEPTVKAEERPDHRVLLEAMDEDAKAGAEALLADPNIISTIYKDISAMGVAGEKRLAATIYLIGVSRLLSKTLSGIVQGPSSSGKSYTIEKVGDLFPREAILQAQQLSPQALFHMPVGALRHRFIVAGERSRREDDDAAEATRALREMISSGSLSKLMAGKDEHGRIVTHHIEQPGPIAYIESTTMTRIFDEDLNRCVLLATDERPEQTARIIKAEAARRSGARAEIDPIILRHHALQRMLALEDSTVVIPFADRLAEMFPTDRTEARRAFGHTLSMIEASALLHVRQRERDVDGRIVATFGDYEVARVLLATPMARSIGGAVSDGAKRLWGRLDWPTGTFTSSDVFKREDYSERAVRGWLGELAHGGFLKVVEARRGAATIYELVADAPDPESVSPLPSTELICGVASGASAVPTGGNL